MAGLSCIFEPNVIYYSIDSSEIENAAGRLEKVISKQFCDKDLVRRCTEQRVLRTNIYNDTVKLTVSVCRFSSFVCLDGGS